MAWTPNSDYASVNRRLQADPRFRAAQQTFAQTLAATPIPTTTQQRAGDDGGAAADAARLARTQAGQAFAASTMTLLKEYGIRDFENLGISPENGQVAYEAPDHSGRNMLIAFGSIAAAGILGPGGVFSGAGGAGAAGGAGGSTIPAATYGLDGAVTNFAAGEGTAAAGYGLGALGGASTYTDLLARYALPTAGNLINGYLQRGDDNDRFAAQQKYLEDALAYAKEKDAYDRQRTEGLDAQERTRYGDYQGRIAPFIKTGTSANARMAQLLGLNLQGNA